MEMLLNYWYKITYSDGSVKIFRFLGQNENGRLLFALYNGDIVENLLDFSYSNLQEIGLERPD